MKRFLALGAILLFPPAAPAFTVDPLPGSAPQTARATAFFRNPVGVVVRGDGGIPLPGVRVFFSQIGGDNVYVSLPQFSFDSVTNSHGVAISEAIASMNPGVVQVSAQVGAVTRVFAPLTIIPAGAVALQLVSGGGQGGRIGSRLKPWVVRAVDANGRAVSYAAVTFVGGSDDDDGEGGLVTFDGSVVATVMADSRGYATSPVPAVKRVGWHEGGQACVTANFRACVGIEFVATDWTVPKSATVASAPLGAELGKAAPGPFAVKVIDATGRPAGGVPVRFSTPDASMENCGSFGGAYDATVPTNVLGIATSPLFIGVVPGMCRVTAWVGGLDDGIPLDLLVYTPEQVSINAPLAIVTGSGRPFQVRVSFNAGADPIHGLPVDVEVIRAANGAGSRLDRPPSARVDSSEVVLDFNANSVAGLYHVAITRGPVRTWIVVDQRGR